MGIKQNKIGHQTESEVANFFSKNSYWAFIIPKGINGQPFDIIARRENETWFIDAKHLEVGRVSFPFDRIEPNQITSMQYANYIANIKDNMGFIIQQDQNLYFMSYETYLKQRELSKSIKLSDLPRLDNLIMKANNI